MSRAVLFLIAATLWTMTALGAACDNTQKLADQHDELLRQEQQGDK